MAINSKKGEHRFALWVNVYGLSKLARDIGKSSREVVRCWMAGKTRPTAKTANLIVEISAKTTVKSWWDSMTRCQRIKVANICAMRSEFPTTLDFASLSLSDRRRLHKYAGVINRNQLSLEDIYGYFVDDAAIKHNPSSGNAVGVAVSQAAQ
jgi:hypothetical protein